MRTPVLVACAHGTDNLDGRATISSIVAQVQSLLPDTKVVETYVDVQHPQIDEVLGALDGEAPTVVVPLLLSAGYHVQFDIAKAVTQRNVTATSCATLPLGPHMELARLQAARVAEVGVAGPCTVIVAAAGSSDARAQHDVEQQVELLKSVVGEHIQVRHGYLSAAQPRVADVVAECLAQSPDKPVVINSYLLATGFFHDKLSTILSDALAGSPSSFVYLTKPLGADSRLAHIAVDRYLDGVTHL